MNSNTYSNRILIARTQDDISAILALVIKNNKNVSLVADEKINNKSKYRLSAVYTDNKKMVSIYTITTNKDARAVYGVFDMVTDLETVPILWVHETVLGVLRLSTFHSFPSIVLADDMDSFLSSKFVGDSIKECQLSQMQKRNTLLASSGRSKSNDQEPAAPVQRKAKKTKPAAKKEKPVKKSEPIVPTPKSAKIPKPYAPSFLTPTVPDAEDWTNIGNV